MASRRLASFSLYCRRRLINDQKDKSIEAPSFLSIEDCCTMEEEEETIWYALTVHSFTGTTLNEASFKDPCNRHKDLSSSTITTQRFNTVRSHSFNDDHYFPW